MVKLTKEGKYSLLETKSQTKILTLDDRNQYAWINAEGIGEILIQSHNKLETDTVLSKGKYRLFEVKEEPELRDLPHLELEVGENEWQGYLLLTGLPDHNDKRNRIIPTEELVGSKK